MGDTGLGEAGREVTLSSLELESWMGERVLGSGRRWGFCC